MSRTPQPGDLVDIQLGINISTYRITRIEDNLIYIIPKDSLEQNESLIYFDETGQFKVYGTEQLFEFKFYEDPTREPHFLKEPHTLALLLDKLDPLDIEKMCQIDFDFQLLCQRHFKDKIRNEFGSEVLKYVPSNQTREAYTDLIQVRDLLNEYEDYGNLIDDILKFLMNDGLMFDPRKMHEKRFELLKLLGFEAGFPVGIKIITPGPNKLYLLEYLYSIHPENFDKFIEQSYVFYNNEDIQWIIDHNFEITEYMIYDVMKSGSIELLGWLIQNNYLPLTEDIDEVIQKLSPEKIDLLFRYELFPSGKSFNYFLDQGKLNYIYKLIGHGIIPKTLPGYVLDYPEIFKLLIEKGVKPGSDVANMALSRNDLETLKMLSSNYNVHPDFITISRAISSDKLKSLKWLIEKAQDDPKIQREFIDGMKNYFSTVIRNRGPEAGTDTWYVLLDEVERNPKLKGVRENILRY